MAPSTLHWSDKSEQHSQAWTLSCEKGPDKPAHVQGGDHDRGKVLGGMHGGCGRHGADIKRMSGAQKVQVTPQDSPSSLGPAQTFLLSQDHGVNCLPPGHLLLDVPWALQSNMSQLNTPSNLLLLSGSSPQEWRHHLPFNSCLYPPSWRPALCLPVLQAALWTVSRHMSFSMHCSQASSLLPGVWDTRDLLFQVTLLMPNHAFLPVSINHQHQRRQLPEHVVIQHNASYIWCLITHLSFVESISVEKHCLVSSLLLQIIPWASPASWLWLSDSLVFCPVLFATSKKTHRKGKHPVKYLPDKWKQAGGLLPCFRVLLATLLFLPFSHCKSKTFPPISSLGSCCFFSAPDISTGPWALRALPSSWGLFG